MWRLKTSRWMFAGVAAATALVGVGAGPSGQEALAAAHPAHLTSNAPVTVVASGLNSPRSLVWGPQGHLIASEVGGAPPTCVGTGFPTTCFGYTGSLADVSSGHPVRIVDGLASNFNQEEVIGANGLTYAGGHLYVLEAGSAQGIPASIPADLRASLSKDYGALLRVDGNSVKAVANPGYADYDWTLAHKELSPNYPESNPYAITNKPGGGFYLVDAAANTLDSVDRHGNVRVLTFVPTTSTGLDAVPSCVAVGPDKSVYIGEITGKPSSSTEAKIFKYNPGSGDISVWQSGFSAVSGCGFGANGDFYVTEFDTTGFLPTGDPYGDVVQINHENNERTVLASGNKLFAPSGFLAGPDGSVYVANKTMMWPACDDAPACSTASDVSAHDGEIVKIG